MNSQDRVEWLVTEWLSELPATAPDQVLEQFLTQLATAPQRRRWALTGRFSMFGSKLFAWGAAAAVAVIALIVVLNVWGGGDDPGPGATSSPSPAPSLVTPSPTVSAPSPTPLSEGPLVPGSYVYDGDGLRVTFTVPAGWEANSAFSVSISPAREGPDGVYLSFHQPDATFRDPCSPDAGIEFVDTADDLEAALAALPNASVTPPSDAILAGLSVRHLAWTAETEDIDCVMALWQVGGFIRAADAGQHEEVWIVDLAGKPLIVDATTFPESTAAHRAELQGIIDSLTIEATE